MGKGKFIAGTILGALSVLNGIAGIYMFYSANHLNAPSGSGEGAMGVAVILILCAYVYTFLQFIFGVAAEIFLWENFKQGECAKTASMIIAVICAAVMAVSIGYIIFLLATGDEKTQSAVCSITNFIKI